MEILNSDSLITVCRYLKLEDVLRLIRTCRSIYIFTLSRPILSSYAYKHITMDRVLEIYGCVSTYENYKRDYTLGFVDSVKRFISGKRSISNASFRDLLLRIIDGKKMPQILLTTITRDEYIALEKSVRSSGVLTVGDFDTVDRLHSVIRFKYPNLHITYSRFEDVGHSKRLIMSNSFDATVVDKIESPYYCENGKLVVKPLEDCKSDTILSPLEDISPQSLIELRVYQLLTEI